MRITFQEIYCTRHRLSPDDFEAVLFRRSLYWHVRPWHWVLTWLWKDYFLADKELVRHAAEACSLRELKRDVVDYGTHYRNRGFLRRVLRLRVSAGRVQDIYKCEVATVLPLVARRQPYWGEA